MLLLKKITKDYVTGDTTVKALKSVDIQFRENEFVSILGPSGCGKTTLLNIIGGLDRYTDGDLIINGKSTKEFKDGDWDVYRNNSIGFVFQSYNLIPHQSVLANVELALTLSGVSKAERRKRAEEVLKKVGLGDQIHKKPNQMSGGQMQRVAIARALVNSPDILLADEPTGALDSETSLQIMELLKEIAKDKLVIMVTHNPDLADKYSTRIIRLLDGVVTDDSNPYNAENEEKAETQSADKKQKKAKKAKKKPMSFFTALSLSMNNLMTKKARTFLTSFAGSIGIIGIALILSLSSGMQAYINRVQEDTLTSYPINIEKNTMNITSMMSSMMESNQKERDHELDKIYSNNIMNNMMETMFSGITVNNLTEFKEYIENSDEMKSYANDIKYFYDTEMNIYNADTNEELYQVNPNTLFDKLGFPKEMLDMRNQSPMGAMTENNGMSGTDIWIKLIGDNKLIGTQYNTVAGRLPENYDEVVLIVDENNEITDFTLYSLGLLDSEGLKNFVSDVMKGKEVKLEDIDRVSYSYDDILNLRYKLLLNTDYYEKKNGVWEDKSKDENFLKEKLDNALEIKVVGIIKPTEGSVMGTLAGSIGYTDELMEYLINEVNKTDIVKEQKDNEDIDVFTGMPFKTDENSQPAEFDMTSLTDEQKMYFASLSEEERAALIEKYTKPKVSDASFDGNMKKLGVSDLNEPSRIALYPKDFESKEFISDIISDYNQSAEDEGKEENVIHYTDIVGLMMSSMKTIINAISYILIAFVAISLVVSSIMIGIITYISVLERTKEIGILRSIGASKKDVSRVFNAETMIVGFAAGAIGIGITLLLLIPINLIIDNLAGIGAIAALPPLGGIILVAISVILTLIAGLIPAKLAAKKDPVVALRTE